MKKILLFSFVLFAQVAFAQFNFGIKQELENGTQYGYQTAVYGNSMFVYKSNVDNVKVYTKQPDATWQLTQTLSPSDKPSTTTTDWSFGSCMALNDSNAIITAVYKGLIKKDGGGLYFYRKGKDGLWKEESIVENPTTFNYYGGKNISIYKNKATVSHNNGYPGFVHIFERNKNGVWAMQDTILRPSSGVFGGIDGRKVFFQDSVFISMFFNFDNQRVKEFRLQKNGTWLDSQTLLPDTTGIDTYFGEDLQVNKNQMAVCSYYGIVNGLKNAGKVYLYERVNKEWVFKQKIASPVPQSNANFGSDLVFKGDDTLIVASSGHYNGQSIPSGALFFFKKENGVWNYKQTFYNRKGSRIGLNVNVSGNQVISFGYSSVFVLENLKDCKGLVGGSAKLNSCAICFGGTSGLDSLTSESKCTTSGIDFETETNLIRVSPNPFTDEIRVNLTSSVASAQLYDGFGKLIEANITSDVYKTSHLKAGIYILVIRDGEKRTQLKLIKY